MPWDAIFENLSVTIICWSTRRRLATFSNWRMPQRAVFHRFVWMVCHVSGANAVAAEGRDLRGKFSRSFFVRSSDTFLLLTR